MKSEDKTNNAGEEVITNEVILACPLINLYIQIVTKIFDFFYKKIISRPS